MERVKNTDQGVKDGSGFYYTGYVVVILYGYGLNMIKYDSTTMRRL